MCLHANKYCSMTYNEHSCIKFEVRGARGGNTIPIFSELARRGRGARHVIPWLALLSRASKLLSYTHAHKERPHARSSKCALRVQAAVGAQKTKDKWAPCPSRHQPSPTLTRTSLSQSARPANSEASGMRWRVRSCCASIGCCPTSSPSHHPPCCRMLS